MEQAGHGGESAPRGPVLHIVVIGFHHKKGCQVEFSYPPLVPGGEHDSHTLPEEWKYLPFLALPDGAHNYQEDTVFFHLPPRNGNGTTVYGVSCYRQIEAKALKVRQADITRETVQKSVCVLSKLPLYGLLQAKLQLITHAYFEEKDFSQISILKELYEHMNSSLGGTSLEGSQVYLGLSPRDLVLHFRHKVLILFKLILLEKKVLFYISPVNKLVGALMTVLSLFPGMIEHGLGDCSQYRPRKSVSEEAGLQESRTPVDDSLSEPASETSIANVKMEGYLCLPYMALQQHHLLSDVTVRGFVAGATNILFRQQKHLSDAVVEVEEALVQIHDPELRKLLSPTTADLRFADHLVKHVTENRDDVFLDGTGWEGGDEWIRAQFAVYLHALLAATLQLDNEKMLSDYGATFVTAWRNTHNYRVWNSNRHPALAEINPNHPFQGQYSVADMKLRFSHSVQNSERGKRIGNAVVTTSRNVVQTGKAVGQSVGGAFSSAKTAVSSWLSAFSTSSPQSLPEPCSQDSGKP
ncbi:late secretory pathway protein AVL9 homolog isoform X3 [Dipodomys spectabilis]|uniref:late secretory pathway protein AVL9 homolog isoform X3 n=1 Tax=Dipodomys spectabilis TaxID=105255 RepID=UPI001C535AF0|nr:late secretory pathway protein AVL9 homolog isoform X3 [Dipodomys spectabilis]